MSPHWLAGDIGESVVSRTGDSGGGESGESGHGSLAMSSESSRKISSRSTDGQVYDVALHSVRVSLNCIGIVSLRML